MRHDFRVRSLITTGVLVGVCGVAVWSRFAPLEAASLGAYAGMVLMAWGLVMAIRPVGVLGVATRRGALALALCGVCVVGVALSWPAPLRRATAAGSVLDEVMPEYEFVERHEVVVAGSPAEVMAAAREVTFEDLKVYGTLMAVRGAMSGQRVRIASRAGQVRLMEAIARPGSGFVTLRPGELEMVMGMAGKPWSRSGARVARTAAEWGAFRDPGAIRTAFNLRAEDAGGGRTRLSTETRSRGTDAAGTRAMGRYWRLILPGSALIREMWMEAAVKRAGGA